MTVPAVKPAPKTEFRWFIEHETGQKAARCYQCGKCTAGCPVAYLMDLGPRRVMRALQLGLKDEVLASNTIWLCVHCQMCSARCPREIDIARVMEACRLLFHREKAKAGDRDAELFHHLFLDSVRRWGRLHELDLAALFNLRSGHLFANLGLVPGLISRGKLAVLPHREAAGPVRGLMARAAESEAAERKTKGAGGKA